MQKALTFGGLKPTLSPPVLSEADTDLHGEEKDTKLKSSHQVKSVHAAVHQGIFVLKQTANIKVYAICCASRHICLETNSKYQSICNLLCNKAYLSSNKLVSPVKSVLKTRNKYPSQCFSLCSK